jgi:hypothetical protein
VEAAILCLDFHGSYRLICNHCIHRRDHNRREFCKSCRRTCAATEFSSRAPAVRGLTSAFCHQCERPAYSLLRENAEVRQ